MKRRVVTQPPRMSAADDGAGKPLVQGAWAWPGGGYEVMATKVG